MTDIRNFGFFVDVSDLGMSGFMCFQSVNLDAWNAAPEKVRAALPKAQEVGTQDMLEAYAAADKKWIPIFHEKLEVVQIKPEVRAQIATGAEKIWEQWVSDQEAKGRPGREMLDFVKSLVANYEK